MKIAIDLTELYDNFSGIERYAYCQTIELISQFPEHEYILLFKNEVHEKLSEYVTREKVSAVILKGKGKLLFSQVTLPRVLGKIDYDLALFFCYPAPYFLKNPKKAVSAIHDMCVYDFPKTMTLKSRLFFRVLFRRAVKKDRAIVTVSEFSKSRILHYYKKTPQIIVAESGVDHIFSEQKEENLALEEDVLEKYGISGNYILTLSTLEPRKNLRLLIDAFCEQYKENDYKLVLAGRKGWKVENLLESLPAEAAERIVCTGFVDEQDLPVLYGKALCFAFPSKYEGFGLPPLEAMAQGTLVVSSDAASMPEVLGDAAIYFNSGDKNSLKEALKAALAAQPNEREERIEKGKERARIYTWTRSASRLMSGLYGKE